MIILGLINCSINMFLGLETLGRAGLGAGAAELGAGTFSNGGGETKLSVLYTQPRHLKHGNIRQSGKIRIISIL